MGDIQTTGRRREVGAELKRIRQQTDLPAYKVAAKLGWTPSHISRSEAGKRRVTDVDAGHYLGICDAPDDELALDGPESRECLAAVASDYERRQGDARHGDRKPGRLAQE